MDFETNTQLKLIEAKNAADKNTKEIEAIKIGLADVVKLCGELSSKVKMADIMELSANFVELSKQFLELKALVQSWQNALIEGKKEAEKKSLLESVKTDYVIHGPVKEVIDTQLDKEYLFEKPQWMEVIKNLFKKK